MMDSTQDFMSITGTSNETEATMWLELANYDFEVAVNMFFSTTGYAVLLTKYCT